MEIFQIQPTYSQTHLHVQSRSNGGVISSVAQKALEWIGLLFSSLATLVLAPYHLIVNLTGIGKNIFSSAQPKANGSRGPDSSNSFQTLTDNKKMIFTAAAIGLGLAAATYATYYGINLFSTPNVSFPPPSVVTSNSSSEISANGLLALLTISFPSSFYVCGVIGTALVVGKTLSNCVASNQIKDGPSLQSVPQRAPALPTKQPPEAKKAPPRASDKPVLEDVTDREANQAALLKELEGRIKQFIAGSCKNERVQKIVAKALEGSRREICSSPKKKTAIWDIQYKDSPEEDASPQTTDDDQNNNAASLPTTTSCDNEEPSEEGPDDFLELLRAIAKPKSRFGRKKGGGNAHEIVRGWGKKRHRPEEERTRDLVTQYLTNAAKRVSEEYLASQMKPTPEEKNAAYQLVFNVLKEGLPPEVQLDEDASDSVVILSTSKPPSAEYLEAAANAKKEYPLS